MLKQGFDKAREITRRNAHTFYLTSLFLPNDKRLAAYTIYAVCRLSDDSVDGMHLSRDQKQKELNDIQARINQAFSKNELRDPLIQAFRQTVERYQIPQAYFDELLQGMAMDLVKSRYQTFDELHLYAYRVAGVIGLIMVKIFGYKDPQAEPCAVSLGLALQLTNILRDIKEDFARGRIYLPQDEMRQYHIGEESLQREIVDENFTALMRFQIKRAREYFLKASHGVALVQGLRCRWVTFLILELYAKILEKIEENHFDVYAQRAHVPTIEKITTLFYLLCRLIRKSFLFKT